jgi:hypothetical protein
MSHGTQGVRHVADDCRETQNRAGAHSEVYDFLTFVRLHNQRSFAGLKQVKTDWNFSLFEEDLPFRARYGRGPLL